MCLQIVIDETKLVECDNMNLTNIFEQPSEQRP